MFAIVMINQNIRKCLQNVIVDADLLILHRHRSGYIVLWLCLFNWNESFKFKFNIVRALCSGIKYCSALLCVSRTVARNNVHCCECVTQRRQLCSCYSCIQSSCELRCGIWVPLDALSTRWIEHRDRERKTLLMFFFFFWWHKSIARNCCS